MKKTMILAFAITLFATFNAKNLNAQTKEEAGTAFNAALELSKSDLAGAVGKMQDVIKMCNVLGADADTIKMNATKVIPVWQYNVGNSFLKTKKYDLATTAFEKSNDLATAYEDENIKQKSGDILVKLYANKGNNLSQTSKYDDAITYFDKALALDPTYGKALYAKGQVYKKKGDNAKMQENMDLAIDAAAKTNDTQIAQAARSTMSSSLYLEGANAFKKKSYTEATEKLHASLAYDTTNKEVYYLLAVSYNNLKKSDEAIESANKGLPLEDKTSIKLARFYYEMAKAYEGKNDTSNACANYQKSAYGTFAQSAKYQMKSVLKCQ